MWTLLNWRSILDPLSLDVPAGYEGYRTLNCIIWRSMLDLDFTYPFRVWRLQDIELHNMKINVWSLEFTYPCRVWRLQNIELHNMKINVWSLESTYPCWVWRLQDIELHNMEINVWSWDSQSKIFWIKCPKKNRQ